MVVDIASWLIRKKSPSRLAVISAILIAFLLPPGRSFAAAAPEPGPIVVGSKKFNESIVLGEVVTLLLRAHGFEAEHRQQLGGTRILWNALIGGDIDIYVEYTGTVSQEIYGGAVPADVESLAKALAESGVSVAARLGFNNSYAIGVTGRLADSLGLRSISDLSGHTDLRIGFSDEFMDRGDGWPALRETYRLQHRQVRGIDHDLAYRGIASGALDVIDLYSTDAEIDYYSLRVLADDLDHFPAYEAIVLVRSERLSAVAGLDSLLATLDGAVTARRMIEMNRAIKIDRVNAGTVASRFLSESMGIESSPAVVRESRAARIVQRTKEHLALVGISLIAAILFAIPLGVLAASGKLSGQIILGIVGAIYTIPSLALLVFMIPLLGIGALPAIVALFLYSLLPIVRNTHTGLTGIPLDLRESAVALGLPRFPRLRHVYLPLASRSILAGIKTSAIINVGTATLGALIGAGGYGQPILSGIRLDDMGLILEGAVPAAALALLVQGAFDVLDLLVVPKGLRLAGES